MAFIRQIEHADATGELKEFYDELAEIAGCVPNIVKLSSLKLPAMTAAQDLYQSVLYHESGLTMEEKEMVATVVSSINGCVYCVNHHGNALTDLTDDPQLTENIVSDFRKAPISDRAMRLLEFADKLTRRPMSMTAESVDILRDHGLTDEDVVDTVQLIAYFNYTSRLATGLGVDPEV